MRSAKSLIFGILAGTLLCTAVGSCARAAPIDWFNFGNEKLDHDSNNAVTALDNGLSQFFRLVTAIRVNNRDEFQMLKPQIGESLSNSAKYFETLALQAPNRKFALSKLSSAEATTFVELRDTLKQAKIANDIPDPKTYFDAVAKLIYRFQSNIAKLQLGRNDPRLFAAIIYDKILIERVGSTAQIITKAMT